MSVPACVLASARCAGVQEVAVGAQSVKHFDGLQPADAIVTVHVAALWRAGEVAEVAELARKRLARKP